MPPYPHHDDDGGGDHDDGREPRVNVNGRVTTYRALNPFFK